MPDKFAGSGFALTHQGAGQGRIALHESSHRDVKLCLAPRLDNATAVSESYPPWHYRGREEPYQTLPSLRTVRAVLPHTALQSVVPISGQIDDLSLLQGASVIATESINSTLLPRYPQLSF